MKKYELTTETIVIDGKTLFRIKALEDFGNAKVYDCAEVHGEARYEIEPQM